MYWYGWLAISGIGALAMSFVAALSPRPWLYRATVFCCVLAALWPALLVAAAFIADRVSFDAEFLKSIWLAGGLALAGAAAISPYGSGPMGEPPGGQLPVARAGRGGCRLRCSPVCSV